MSLLSLKRSESNEKTSVFPGPSHLSEVPSKSCARRIRGNPLVALSEKQELFIIWYFQRRLPVLLEDKSGSLLTEPWMEKMLQFQSEGMIRNLRLDCCDRSSPMALEGAFLRLKNLWWNMILWTCLYKAKEMKKSARKLWALKFNMEPWKSGPARSGDSIVKKPIIFRFQGVVYENPPTCSQLQWSWRLEPSKIQNLNSSLVTSILFSQPFLKSEAPRQNRCFLFHRKICTYQSSTYPLFVGCLIVDMVVL